MLLDGSNVHLRLRGVDHDYTFSCPELEFSHTLDGREISCDMNDAHTGVMIAFIGRSAWHAPVRIHNLSYEPS